MLTFNKNSTETNASRYLSFLSDNEVLKVKDFHKSFPQYSQTPLNSLTNLAKQIGLGGIFIKDESYRFGLNAFKVLGGSYAMGMHLAETLGVDISELPYSRIISKDIKQKLGSITFVTATDGNHGKGVAWTANRIGMKSSVYMPRGSSEKRLKNILEEGSDAKITDMNYDDTVIYAANRAKEEGGILIQDTAWNGYEEVPRRIMQGYVTIVAEVFEQLRLLNVEKPTHMFLQAGVGSFPASILGYYAGMGEFPITTIVEPDLADCFYKSAVCNDGMPHAVTGEMPTIMAGLACGCVNPLAWDIIKNYAFAFASCPDYITANGMRILANPLKDDSKIVSGESGAVTLGLLYELMTNERYREQKEQLGLDENSRVLLFSTEGATDPEMYRQIVWLGR